ncbi:unnamed protein product [Ectocarpus sp. 12 AP-2014]
MSTQEDTETVFTTDAIAFEVALLVAFTAGLVWYYAAKDVPFLVSVCVFTSWLLGFIGTLLLPADIVLTLLNGSHSLWMTRVWYAVYWTTFLLAWVILPILYQAWNAGELTWAERIRRAVRLNIKQYLAMAVLLVVFVIYLVVSGQTSAGSVSGFMMALANTYGLLFIILLLGQGLIQVPRQLWETSFNDTELQRLYFNATQVDTDKHDSLFELETLERNLDSMERAMDIKKHWCIKDRAHMKNMLSSARATDEAFHLETDDGSFQTTRFRGKNGSKRWDEGRTPEDALKDLGVSRLTPRDAARLHSSLRAAQVNVVASRMKWAALLKETDTLLCIVNNEIPWGDAVCETTPGETVCHYLRTVLRRTGNRAGWVWRAYLRALVCKALALLCAGLSGVILWSEVMAASRWNLSPFGILLRLMYQQEAGIGHALSMQAAVLVPFLYMSLCCYRSLFTLRIFGTFRLQGGHHTLPGPLLFNAQYLIRLQFPLGYNFMRMLRYYGTKSASVPALSLPAFQKLMNDMSTVPVLGTGFTVYAPLVLVILCAFTYYKGYARVLRLVGLEHVDLVSMDDPGGNAVLDEGRELVERGKRQAQALAARRRDATVQQSPPSDSPSTKDEPGGYVAPSLYSKVGDGCSSPDVENVGSPTCSINGDGLGGDDPDGQDSAF